MSAVDDRSIEFKPDQMGLNNIGPDQAKAEPAVVQASNGNLRSAFGQAHGPGIRTGIELAPQPQPNDPWANTGPQRNPILDKVDQTGATLGADAPKGANLNGAAYLSHSVGNMLGELFGTKPEPSPQAMQLEMSQPRPQPQPFGL